MLSEQTVAKLADLKGAEMTVFNPQRVDRCRPTIGRECPLFASTRSIAASPLPAQMRHQTAPLMLRKKRTPTHPNPSNIPPATPPQPAHPPRQTPPKPPQTVRFAPQPPVPATLTALPSPAARKSRSSPNGSAYRSSKSPPHPPPAARNPARCSRAGQVPQLRETATPAATHRPSARPFPPATNAPRSSHPASPAPAGSPGTTLPAPSPGAAE